MTSIPKPRLKFILDYLAQHEEFAHGQGYASLNNPFQVAPQDYLRFARSNLESGAEDSNINALANAKRALDSQLNSILATFLTSFDKDSRWGKNVPKRLEFLQKIGAVTPNILGKINRARNSLEHDFVNPSRSDVEMALDVVTIFVEYTTALFGVFPIDVFLDSIEVSINSSEMLGGISLCFDPVEKTLFITCYVHGEKDREEEYILKSDDDVFPDILKGLIHRKPLLKY